MSLRAFALTAITVLPITLRAQGGAAQVVLPPVAEQLVAAALPLPANMRDGAGVLGYKTAGKLEQLKPSKNGMICLADDPTDNQFHVACYHESMEPFMARGRSLRAGGTTGDAVDTARFAEVKKGTLKLPAAPASLYTLTGPKGDFDPATGLAAKSRALFVVYIPYATTANTGIASQPGGGKPWIMFAGTPKAHIMFTQSM